MGGKKPYTGLLLIGAGLPRTGTFSTRTALEMILEGPCYHMRDVLISRKHMKFWEEIQRGTLLPTEENFQDMFKEGKFVAAVDHPASQYYKVLMDAFPEAKVLLTVREPEKWYLSVRNTIYYMGVYFRTTVPYRWIYWLTGFLRAFTVAFNVNPEMYLSCGRSEEEGVDFYNKWVEEVKANVPPERLLVFSVKEGWGPLCNFLGVPVPDVPFPHVNDTATFQRRIQFVKVFTWSSVIVGTAALIGVCVGTVSYFQLKYFDRYI